MTDLCGIRPGPRGGVRSTIAGGLFLSKGAVRIHLTVAIQAVRARNHIGARIANAAR